MSKTLSLLSSRSTGRLIEIEAWREDGGDALKVLFERAAGVSEACWGMAMAEPLTKRAIHGLLTHVRAATAGSEANAPNIAGEVLSQGSQESSGTVSGDCEVDYELEDIEPEQFVRIVEGVGDFDSIGFGTLNEQDILRFEFADLQAAYDFYNEYGRVKGFSVRRSKM
ncbi:hypothetical protein PIB30_098914 [Stylosanthes scabra]|uniref:Uncharacterized protein n=1 Tax=Stylosanthes scabra TaxID=79078 RepID=A0ABU6ZVG5_9FABA|nr:hypothetical protein [Stylosanthes scabra]